MAAIPVSEDRRCYKARIYDTSSPVLPIVSDDGTKNRMLNPFEKQRPDGMFDVANILSILSQLLQSFEEEMKVGSGILPGDYVEEVVTGLTFQPIVLALS